jgi:hypothetical protein
MTSEREEASASAEQQHGSRATALRLDLIVIIVVSAVSAAVCVLAPSSISPLRVACALLLVFVLPGYGLVALAYPPGVLSLVHRLIGIFALSLMPSILGGLFLSQMGFDLTSTVWCTMLALLAVIASLVAQIRWRHSRYDNIRKRPVRLHWSAAPLLLGACLIVATGIYVSVRSAQSQEQREPPFTELSAQTTTQATGSRPLVKIVVRSHEDIAEDYRLVVDAGGRPLRAYRFTLQPGERWTVSLTAPEADDGEALTHWHRRLLWDGHGRCGRRPLRFDTADRGESVVPGEVGVVGQRLERGERARRGVDAPVQSG